MHCIFCIIIIYQLAYFLPVCICGMDTILMPPLTTAFPEPFYFHSITIRLRHANILMQIEEIAKNKKFCTIIILADQVLEIV